MSMNETQLLRVLHDEHAPALWRYVVHLSGDAALAEDIVQEVLFRAWRRPQVLDQSERSARAWLFSVARNLVIDEKRSARSRNEVGGLPFLERAAADETDALLDSWLVSDAITQLTDDHRAVITQCYYLGRSTSEAAKKLEIPEGTVKSRLHYALRSLRLALQERGVTQP
jgi:RNA polymerase sigma-70 factor, ECF subfamily